MVPDSADADVVIAPITNNAIGQAITYYLTINAGENFVENTVAATDNYIVLNGTLIVDGAVSLGAGSVLDMDGGFLSAGTLEDGGFDIQGSGTIATPNAFANTGTIIGDGLTLDVGTLQNSGELLAQGRV